MATQTHRHLSVGVRDREVEVPLPYFSKQRLERLLKFFKYLLVQAKYNMKVLLEEYHTD